MLKQKRHHKKSAFLQKTYDMIETMNYHQIISWNPDGVGFIIHDCAKFSQIVLPSYFKHSNFNSFIRQLNMYGFSKKRSSKTENYYYHQKFQKGQKDLIADIHRRVQKKHPRSTHNKSKICSEFSIELQSHNQTKKHDSETNISEQLCLQFYRVMNTNQNILNSQLIIINEIIKDLKALKLKNISKNLLEVRDGQIVQQQQQHVQLFSNYINSHIQLREQILERAKTEIKDSQKYIQSLGKLQTQQNLNQHIQFVRNADTNKIQ